MTDRSPTTGVLPFSGRRFAVTIVPTMAHLDGFNRPISYLRISVTDRCNLRCTYCMPPEGVAWRPHGEILRYEEIETVVRAAAQLGVSKVRVTGGEPLVRPGIVELIRMLASVPGVDDMAMTSNGTLLSRYAHDLATAGLQRVNISLDTLYPERFRQVTLCGELNDALAGIQAARDAGLTPVKINMVVIRGVNDDEVAEFARKTVADSWHVRFIELMPFGDGSRVDETWRDRVVTAPEVRTRIEAALGPLAPAEAGVGSGPARYFRLPGAGGTLGFITPVSDHFCFQCNRLRLTADGQLRLCLLSDAEVDLRSPLRQGASVDDIKLLLAGAIRRKPMQHHLDERRRPAARVMSEIGG